MNQCCACGPSSSTVSRGKPNCVHVRYRLYLWAPLCWTPTPQKKSIARGTTFPAAACPLLFLVCLFTKGRRGTQGMGASQSQLQSGCRQEHFCYRCGHQWWPRGQDTSSRCPSCRSGSIDTTGNTQTPTRRRINRHNRRLGVSAQHTRRRPDNFCFNCKHQWVPRGRDVSARCPHCAFDHVISSELLYRDVDVEDMEPRPTGCCCCFRPDKEEVAKWERLLTRRQQLNEMRHRQDVFHALGQRRPPNGWRLPDDVPLHLRGIFH